MSPSQSTQSTPLVQVRDLAISYPSSQGRIQAVSGVSFEIERGQTVGLVGESGSGKSTIGRFLVGLVKADQGLYLFDSKKLSELDERAFRPWRKRLQLVFQDAARSLNPRRTVAQLLAEPLEVHFRGLDSAQRAERTAELLAKVGLDESFRDRYPAQLSGGQRQRVGIARAIAVEPDFLVCDEPVSALDVSIQAQILNLLRDLQSSMHLTMLMISHDLAVVEHMSNRVLVMREGRIVEDADSEQIYRAPRHPYTRELLAAAPQL